MNPTSSPHPALTPKLLVAATLLPSLLVAQTPPAPNAASDDPIVLNPFRVDTTKDQGYRATNTVTGTLLNTPIKDVPFAIDVFTRDFIQDLGASDFRQVLEYDSGVQLFNTLAGGTTQREDGLNRIENRDSETQVRGYSVPALENGFFTDYRQDTISIGRIERAGGPSSLLYGIGAMSGVPNTISRVPSYGNRGRIQASVGTFDFFRVEFDPEREVYRSADGSSRLGVGLYGALQTRARLEGSSGNRIGDAWDDTRIENTFISPVLLWQPFRYTEVKLAFSHSTRDNYGNGVTDVADASRPQLSTGETQLLGRDVFGLGRSINISGKSAFTEESAIRLHTEITQRLGSHISLLLQHQYDDYSSEGRVSQIDLLNANQVPTTVPADQKGPDGRALRYFWLPATTTDRESHQLRASALLSYDPFEGNRWIGGNQQVVLGVQYSERLQLDYEQSNVTTGRDIFYRSWQNLSPLTFNNNVVSVPFRDRYRYRWLTGNYAIYQGSFWGDRIRPTVGFRRERYQSRGIEYRYTNGIRNPNYQTTLNLNRLVVSPSGYTGRGTPTTRTDPTYGLSLRITDNINVYGTVGRGISIANETQTDGYGQQFEARELKNKEVGVKFDILKGKISGRAAFFKGEQYNNVRNLFYAVGTGRNSNFDPTQPVVWNLPSGVYRYDNATERAYLQGLFNQAAQILASGQPLPAGDVNTLLFPSRTRSATNNNPNMDRGSYVTTDDESEGYELSLDFNITKNLTGKVSYTHNEITILNGVSGLVDPTAITGLDTVLAYLGPSNFSDPTRPSTYNGSAQRGAKLNDTPEDKYTAFVRYSFDRGFLKGANVRGGVRYESERVAQGLDAAFDRVSGVADSATVTRRPLVPATTFFDLGVGYQLRWKDHPVTFDVFVRNLLDKQKVQATNSVGTTRLYLDPRDIRFTVGIAF